MKVLRRGSPPFSDRSPAKDEAMGFAAKAAKQGPWLLRDDAGTV